MIDIHTVPCDHADKPHRVFVGRDIGKTRAFDDQAEAVAHAESVRCNPENIWLIKVYVSDDDYDSHTCWQWRPIEPAVQPDETVRIEKDHPRRLVTPKQFMTAVGRGIGLIAFVLVVLAILGGLAFTAFEAWAWMLNG
jgi:hypothetical protein